MELSVIIRTYNSAGFAQEAIDSTLNQTLDRDHYEIIVVDDGSSDGTTDLLRDYDNRIRIIAQDHQGAAQASNRGIMESRGTYVTLLDADDALERNALESMLGAMQRDPSIDFLYYDYIEESGAQKKIVSTKDNIFDTLACGIIFRRSLFDEAGLYDGSLVFGEYDLLIRLMRLKKIGRHIPLAFYHYRRTGHSLTSDKDRVEKGIAQLREKYGVIAEKIRRY